MISPREKSPGLAVVICWLLILSDLCLTAAPQLGGRSGGTKKCSPVENADEEYCMAIYSRGPSSGSPNELIPTEVTARLTLRDKNTLQERPLGDAEVTFEVSQGPSGAAATFADGSTRIVVRTLQDGQATIQGLRTNDTPGEYTILASARINGIELAAGLAFKNVKPSWFSRNKWKVAAGTVVAAVAAVVAGNKSNKPEPPGPVIIRGAGGSVGGP